MVADRTKSQMQEHAARQGEGIPISTGLLGFSVSGAPCECGNYSKRAGSAGSRRYQRHGAIEDRTATALSAVGAPPIHCNLLLVGRWIRPSDVIMNADFRFTEFALI